MIRQYKREGMSLRFFFFLCQGPLAITVISISSGEARQITAGFLGRSILGHILLKELLIDEIFVSVD
jgi:hypothetical protein